jgi:hypothetical protein
VTNPGPPRPDPAAPGLDLQCATTGPRGRRRSFGGGASGGGAALASLAQIRLPHRADLRRAAAGALPEAAAILHVGDNPVHRRRPSTRGWPTVEGGAWRWWPSMVGDRPWARRSPTHYLTPPPPGGGAAPWWRCSDPGVAPW